MERVISQMVLMDFDENFKRDDIEFLRNPLDVPEDLEAHITGKVTVDAYGHGSLKVDVQFRCTMTDGLNKWVKENVKYCENTRFIKDFDKEGLSTDFRVKTKDIQITLYNLILSSVVKSDNGQVTISMIPDFTFVERTYE